MADSSCTVLQTAPHHPCTPLLPLPARPPGLQDISDDPFCCCCHCRHGCAVRVNVAVTAAAHAAPSAATGQLTTGTRAATAAAAAPEAVQCTPATLSIQVGWGLRFRVMGHGFRVLGGAAHPRHAVNPGGMGKAVAAAVAATAAVAPIRLPPPQHTHTPPPPPPHPPTHPPCCSTWCARPQRSCPSYWRSSR